MEASRDERFHYRYRLSSRFGPDRLRSPLINPGLNLCISCVYSYLHRNVLSECVVGMSRSRGRHLQQRFALAELRVEGRERPREEHIVLVHEAVE